MTDCHNDTRAESSRVKKSSVSEGIIGDGYLRPMTSRGIWECVFVFEE